MPIFHCLSYSAPLGHPGIRQTTHLSYHGIRQTSNLAYITHVWPVLWSILPKIGIGQTPIFSCLTFSVVTGGIEQTRQHKKHVWLILPLARNKTDTNFQFVNRTDSLVCGITHCPMSFLICLLTFSSPKIMSICVCIDTITQKADDLEIIVFEYLKCAK